jgi:hypothetical protein
MLSTEVVVAAGGWL